MAARARRGGTGAAPGDEASSPAIRIGRREPDGSSVRTMMQPSRAMSLRQEVEGGHHAFQAEIPVVEADISRNPVGVEVEGDGIDGCLLAAMRLGRIEIGDGDG